MHFLTLYHEVQLSSGACSSSCQTSLGQLLESSKVSFFLLVVILVVVNDNALIVFWRPHACILSLVFNQYSVVIVESTYARCAVVVAVLIDSI